MEKKLNIADSNKKDDLYDRYFVYIISSLFVAGFVGASIGVNDFAKKINNSENFSLLIDLFGESASIDIPNSQGKGKIIFNKSGINKIDFDKNIKNGWKVENVLKNGENFDITFSKGNKKIYIIIQNGSYQIIN